ncbi:hypothetical protein ACRALDRAFT_2060993 [Sodiomyces alcalophilus JCM 7366]|uniref:uncharacterized protein n=1 Tax=Sodiomyces alcalophilus JCM 7366 TaxID=591952 RepID=UPI0039B56C79
MACYIVRRWTTIGGYKTGIRSSPDIRHNPLSLSLPLDREMRRQRSRPWHPGRIPNRARPSADDLWASRTLLLPRLLRSACHVRVISSPRHFPDQMEW